jgi:prepilin-type N-terminal cleavage/methylation domain-containing protein
MSGPRGFSLIEVLVALVVSAILSALAFDTVARVHRAARGRGERAGLETTLRNAVLPIARELESAGSDSIAGPDLMQLAPQSVSLRAGRGLLVVCRLALPDTLIVETSGAAPWLERTPAAGRDSLLLYLPGDSAAVVDAWLPLPLTAGPFAGTCPIGSAGWRLVTGLDTATARARGAGSPTVVRFFEAIAFRLYGRLYGSGSLWQIGQEGLSAGALVQPLAGPLRPLGIEFVGLSSGLVPGAPPASVATVRIRALAPGHRDAALGPGIAPWAIDSLAVLAPLRNAR